MFFIIPQAWITPAIAAAAMSFGNVKSAEDIHIKYRKLPGLSARQKPDKILIDKLPAREWTKEKAQCVLVFQYARLAGEPLSRNRRSIMYPVLRYPICHHWLIRHHVN